MSLTSSGLGSLLGGRDPELQCQHQLRVGEGHCRRELTKAQEMIDIHAECGMKHRKGEKQASHTHPETEHTRRWDV